MCIFKASSPGQDLRWLSGSLQELALGRRSGASFRAHGGNVITMLASESGVPLVEQPWDDQFQAPQHLA